ncbi:MAG TPA: hypothetical protein VM821_00500 [Abditibacteriaceae bacterium]|nr:hypothetical protein [Abditibacteriaceae bacterium]
MFRPLGTNTVSHSEMPFSTRPRTQSSTRFLRLSPALCAIALAALFTVPSHAVTTLTEGSATTAMPGGVVRAHGMRTAVISATVTSGDAINAQRALVAANTAIARTRDFYPVPTSQVASALNALSTRGGTDLRLSSERRRLTNSNTPYSEPDASDARAPVDAQDMRALGKKLKAQRAVMVFVSPGDSSDTSATFDAVAELYDTKTGSLVGRGEGTFTATLDAAASDGTASDSAPSIVGDRPAINGRARTTVRTPMALPIRALGGAVMRAVQELNRPIELRGTVLSIPGAYQARVSLSEFKGLRNGARVEFLEGGSPVAYGTVSSVGAGEAVVTVAPERAFSSVYVNMQVRNANNPTLVRAGKTDQQLDEQEYKRFETEFAVSLAAAGLLYLAFD